MLKAKDVKTFAKKSGADLVGIASMDRFAEAPKQMDPRYIFPEAKAMIVMGFRIPRGCFRGIEEGTYFISYTTVGYANLNKFIMPTTLRKVTLFLEDNGYEAVPMPMSDALSAVSEVTGEKGKTETIPVSPEKPAPDVFIHFRLAAVAAGLGEIGYSKLLLTPEFGPRQRVIALLTDAPLEPDPLFSGKLCDRCMLCVKNCPGKAISATETVKVNIGGKECEWGKLDTLKCSVAYAGGVKEFSPFFPQDTVFQPTGECRSGDGRPELKKIMPVTERTLSGLGHWPAIGGGKGCIRECMIHLEKEGKLKAKFHEPFRKKKSWSL